MFTYLEHIDALLRLTEDGTSHFNKLVEMKQEQSFFDQMKVELSESIPLEISQLSISNKPKYDVVTKQILIGITINSGTSRSKFWSRLSQSLDPSQSA